MVEKGVDPSVIVREMACGTVVLEPDWTFKVAGVIHIYAIKTCFYCSSVSSIQYAQTCTDSLLKIPL